jgi:hypothetical protein
MTLVVGETTPLDVATAIVAGYAALVATLALGFRVFSWLRTWQTRLHVELRRRVLATAGTPASEHEPVILFSLVNHSGHPVKVTHVGLEPLRSGGKNIFIPHPLGRPVAGPFEIGPRDSADVWIRVATVTDYDLDWKTRALVSTSDRRNFKSKRVRVRELLGED